MNVRYKATADFSDLIAQSIKARAAYAALNREIQQGDKNSVASAAASAAARRRSTEAITDETTAVSGSNRAMRQAAAISTSLARSKADEARASDISTAAAVRATRAQKQLRDETGRFANAAKDAGSQARRMASDVDNAGTRAQNMGRKFETAVRQMLGIRQNEPGISGALSSINRGLTKIGDWRPNITPPFIALIPILGSVIALVNPLVAGVGALGGVAIGAASSLGTLAGAAAGLVPALSAALGVAAALKTALGGVGGALKAGINAANTAAVAAAGGGSSGSAAAKQNPYTITAVEKITRAQQAYRNALQDVKFAEKGVMDARRAYKRQVDDLTQSIKEYTNATKAADAANVEEAQQNYDNVLASSASTKADKDAALAAIQQAKNKQQDDATQNTRDEQDLRELKQGGVNNNQSVVQAERSVQAAKDAARDAQVAIKNAKYDQAHPVTSKKSSEANKAATAADQFSVAMGKLSPAAQEFVKWFLKFRDAWLVVQKAVQQAFFSQFVKDLGLVNGMLPSIQRMLVPIAAALGKITDNLIRQFSNPTWKRDIAAFGTDLAPILLIAGSGLQSLLNAFRDLTMAGLPFLKQVVNWLALGAVNFARFIEKGRKTGSIQSYLDNVFGVMQKWWTVIKNISATLYNYGKAAGPFGQWLTDGIVKMTGAWKEASKAATAKDSPFQKYLKDIEPLLSNMSGLLGQFFRWFAKVASDPKNIKIFNELVSVLRKDLGPALGRLLDTLAKSGLAEDLAKALANIADAIDTIMKNGGITGFKTFYGIVSNFFTFLAWFSESPGGKLFFSSVLPALGVLAGLTFIGKFSGITAFLGVLAKVAGSNGVLELVKGLGRGIFAGGGAVTAGRAAKGATEAGEVAKDAGTAARAAKTVGAAGRAGESLGGIMRVGGGVLGAALLGLLTKGKGIPAGAMAGKAEGAAAAEGKSGGVIGSILKTIFGGEREEEAGEKEGGKGFAHLKDFKSVEGLGGKLFLGYSIYDALKMGGEALGGEDNGKGSEYFQEGRKDLREGLEEKDPRKRSKAINRTLNRYASNAAGSIVGGSVLGAVDGGTIGGEILPGVGILPGAAIGTVYGGATAMLRDIGGTRGLPRIGGVLGSRKGREALDEESKKLQGPGSSLLSQFLGGGIKDISNAAKKGGPAAGFAQMILGSTPGGFIASKVGDALGGVAKGGGKGVADFVGGSAKDAGKSIGKMATDAFKGIQSFGKSIGKTWSAATKTFRDAAKKVQDWWNDQVVRPFKAACAAIGRLWDQYVTTPFKKMAKAIGDWWQDDVVANFKKMAKSIGDWWQDDVVAPFKKMAKAVGDWWNRNVVGPFQRMAKSVGDWWNKNVVGPFQRMAKSIGDWWNKNVVSTFHTVGNAIHSAWGTLMRAWNAVSSAIGSAWNNIVVKPFNTVSAAVGRAWNGMVKTFTGVAGTLSKAWNTYVIGPVNKVTSGIAGFIKKVTSINIGDLLTNFFNGIAPNGKSSSGSKGGFSSGGGGAFGGGSGGASGKWTSTINQALKMAGAPASWGADIASIIQHESGGNPKAINLWDSNAKAGHPSQGLMQTIPSTFAAYAGSLRGRGITDPLANIYAGIKYIQSRYGSVNNVPGIASMRSGGGYKGYAAGGEVQGNTNSDLVHALLTSKEYVLNKKAVAKIGVSNLNNINSGAMDPRQALVAALQSNALMTMPGMMRRVTAPSSGNTYNTFGDIIINNPKPQAAPDSLARTVRKVAYLHRGR